jgi:hypothetical protein
MGATPAPPVFPELYLPLPQGVAQPVTKEPSQFRCSFGQISCIYSFLPHSFIPPFGIGFCVSCSIGECSTAKVTPRLVPYVLVLSAGLLVVTFISWFVPVLPRIFHLIR